MSNPSAVRTRKQRRIYDAMTQREKTAIRRNKFMEQFGTCPICDRAMDEYSCTLDHKRALARGGTNQYDNFQVLHHDCNQLKSSLSNEQARKKYIEVHQNTSK